MSKRRLTIALALFGAGAVFISAIFIIRGGPPPASEWNLLWIVVDDLKADHLGAAGYERKVTPNIDRVARSGVRFEWTITQAPWSLPSYASMLTSRYPHELVLGQAYLDHIKAETDVARSRDPARMPDMNHHWYAALNPEVPTIAEVLAGNGMETAAFVNNAWLKPGTYGLERGFNHYHDGLKKKSPYTPADKTAEHAAAWIRKRAGSRWFAFIQLMDPHKPYQRHKDIEFGERGIDLYDAEIKFADRAISRLLAELEAIGVADRTVVVINSDHGEGVYEDDARFVGHGGGVIPAIVRVPLVIRWPGGPSGRVVTAMCENLDVMPTALELLEVPAPEGIMGTSLVGAALSKQPFSDRPARVSAVLKGPEQMAVLFQAGAPDEVYQAVAIPAYEKITVWAVEGSELRPATPPKGVARRLIDELRSMVSEAEEGITGHGPGLPPDLDEEAIRSLRALGYFNE